MTPEEIPQELVDLLDGFAGKTHSRQGSVLAALAAILTRYDELELARARTMVAAVADGTARLMEALEPVRDAATGYRVRLLGSGWPSDVASRMAGELHAAMMANVVAAIQSPTVPDGQEGQP